MLIRNFNMSRVSKWQLLLSLVRSCFSDTWTSVPLSHDNLTFLVDNDQYKQWRDFGPNSVVFENAYAFELVCGWESEREESKLELKTKQ